MKARFQCAVFDYEFPFQQEPPWKDRVSRWYQLDASAYGMVSSYYRLAPQLPPPDWILLASPQASNEVDQIFAQTGALSPSLFVHTLPNIRATSLLEISGWQGPLLCLQNDPATVVQALGLALASAASQQKRRAWVFAVSPLESKKSDTDSSSSLSHRFCGIWIDDTFKGPFYNAEWVNDRDQLTHGPNQIIENDSRLISWIQAPQGSQQLLWGSGFWKLGLQV